MQYPPCPKCNATQITKSGIINGSQRYKCKACNYNYTVQKLGKSIDSYMVIKSLQLYIEGVSYREIERLLGVSHVSVMNWVKKYNVKVPKQTLYTPTYRILSQPELIEYCKKLKNLANKGMIVTELGDKFMVIQWDRFTK